MLKINIILGSSTQNPLKGGGIAKISTSAVQTTRSYSASISQDRRNALEHLHSTREKRYSLQRALVKLKETKGMEERQAEEEQLKTEISALKSLEMAAEQVFKNTE